MRASEGLLSGKRFTRRQILVSLGTLFTGTTVAKVLTAVTLIVIARQVMPEAYGQYVAAFAVLRLSSVLFGLGLDNWLLHHGNLGMDAAGFVEAVSTSLAIRFVLGSGWIALVVALTWLPYLSPIPPAVLIMAAICVWLEELSRLIYAALQSSLRNEMTVMLMITSQLLIVGAAGVLALLGVQDITQYLYAQMIATGIGAAIACTWQVTKVGFRVRPQLMRPIIRSSVPFGLSAFLAMVYGQADVAIVAFVLGAGAAGIYAPAISIVVALTLVAGTLFPVMVPVLSQKQATDPANLPAAARTLLLASLGLGVVLAVFLLVSGPALALLLYGPAYAQVGVILQILSGVLLLRSPIFAAGAILVAVGRQRQRVMVQAVSAGANVGLNLLLVGATGVIGVAYVYIFSELILITGQLLILWRHGHLRSPERAALHP